MAQAILYSQPLGQIGKHCDRVQNNITVNSILYLTLHIISVQKVMQAQAVVIITWNQTFSHLGLHLFLMMTLISIDTGGKCN